MAEPRPKRPRDLEEMIHWVLLVGGGAAAIALVSGLVAAVLQHQGLPRGGVNPERAWRSLLEGRAEGLSSLGLILLILTPVTRVVGAIFALLRLRDFRYALISLVVLCLMGVSLWLGKG